MHGRCPIRTFATCDGALTNFHALVALVLHLNRASKKGPNLIICGQLRDLEFTVSTKEPKSMLRCLRRPACTQGCN